MLPTFFFDLQDAPVPYALVAVEAPADARAVLAVLPSGDTASLTWDALRERWFAPVTVPAGTRVSAYVMDAGGGTTRLTGATRAADLDVLVEIEDGFTRVTVFAEEPLRSLVVSPVGETTLAETRALGPEDDVWAHVFELPGMWEEVGVAAVDVASHPIAVRASVPFGG